MRTQNQRFIDRFNMKFIVVLTSCILIQCTPQTQPQPTEIASPIPSTHPISSSSTTSQEVNMSKDINDTSIRIPNVPHIKQEPDFCGEALVESYTRALGQPWTQHDVFNISGMDPSRGMGNTTTELKRALTRIGFNVGAVWYKISVSSASSSLESAFAELHQDLLRGIPSIVCMRYDHDPQTTEHFRLILGYEKGRVIYHEPAIERGGYVSMDRSDFLSLWPLKYHQDQWTLIRFRLEVNQIQTPPTSTQKYQSADYAQHILKLQSKIPSHFPVYVEPPFVVIGDGSDQQVKKWAQGTVRWAVHHLKKAYFSKDPDSILNIWLFKDQKSYETHTQHFFGTRPDTPYGYYSPSDGALVMNIATGGGTLVHEIVHPFIESNFPNCPAWFNEGLGSLYEQSSQRAGQIIGLTNWRLQGLQEAIQQKKLPSFKWLLSTNQQEFYADPWGTNYAHARYLLYYLQERGLLHSYYHKFYAQQQQDPSGYQTLQEILGEQLEGSFTEKWATFVLQLKFP